MPTKLDRVTSDGGDIVIHAAAGIDDVHEAEILHVPGGRIGPTIRDERTLEWVRTIASRANYVTAMCVGRAIIETAGLLDDVKVASLPLPLPKHGSIEVDYRLVADGKFVTGANAASTIDVGLYIVAQYVDEATARAIQVALEYDADYWAPPFHGRALAPRNEEKLQALMGLVSAGPRAEIVREILSLANESAHAGGVAT